MQKAEGFGDKIMVAALNLPVSLVACWWQEEGILKAGLYLDGGFGVGKTHLLASLWHCGLARRRSVLLWSTRTWWVAVTFRKTVEALSSYKLVCIDEFELDDPGDTVSCLV